MIRLGALLLACALPALASAEPLPVIDAHTHTDFDDKPEPASGIVNSRAEYLRELKEAGVVGAVAFTADHGQGYVDLKAQNVVHCAGVREEVRAAELEAGLKDGKYRCLKIYLGYAHRFASDPLYEPVYALARKYDVPV